MNHDKEKTHTVDSKSNPALLTLAVLLVIKYKLIQITKYAGNTLNDSLRRRILLRSFADPALPHRHRRVHRRLIAVQILDDEADHIVAEAASSSFQRNISSLKVKVLPVWVAGVAGWPCAPRSSHFSSTVNWSPGWG